MFVTVLLTVCYAVTVVISQPRPFSAGSSPDHDPSKFAPRVQARTNIELFTLSAVGGISAPIEIEDWGLAKVALEETRAVDTFILNGTTLFANNQDGYCAVSPDYGLMACGDMEEELPQSVNNFSIASNGSLVYNGSANWWACPFQDPSFYVVYYRNMGSNCKFIQLQSRANSKARRSTSEHSVKKILPNHTADLDTRVVLEKTCFFHMKVSDSTDRFTDLNGKLKNDKAFTLLGRCLGTGLNRVHYCFINATTSKLVCVDKASEELMENFHSIDFDINDKGFLLHNGLVDWVFCRTSKGWDGPYSDKKVSDSDCEAFTVQIMVATIPRHDCRPQVINKSILARADTKPGGPVVACPTNLADTLFQSPTLLVPISFGNKTKAMGAAKKITITPTQNMAFNFMIPSTKPYNQQCALLLVLTEFDYLNIDYQEGKIPSLQFFEVGGPVDEHTTSETMPISPLLVSKTFPNEIRPGKNNFITTLPCGSRVLSIMIASTGGLSLGLRQEGVPSESGLHIVPCAERDG